MFRLAMFAGLMAAAVAAMPERAMADGYNVNFYPGPVGISTPKLGFDGTYHMLYGRYSGIFVSDVYRYSLASRVGLERGDVIVKINGTALRSDADYHRALRNARDYNYGNVRLLVDNRRNPGSLVAVSFHLND